MDKGFIMLSRKFFSNEMWEAARTFSECEAWLDLIQSARFEATDTIEHMGEDNIRLQTVSSLVNGNGENKKSRHFLPS